MLSSGATYYNYHSRDVSLHIHSNLWIRLVGLFRGCGFRPKPKSQLNGGVVVEVLSRKQFPCNSFFTAANEVLWLAVRLVSSRSYPPAIGYGTYASSFSLFCRGFLLRCASPPHPPLIPGRCTPAPPPRAPAAAPKPASPRPPPLLRAKEVTSMVRSSVREGES
jgi:hypothetical protein